MEAFDVASENATAIVRCCLCGLDIEPNPSNMCAGCLRNQVNITEGISEQATLHFCRGCERYLQPPSEWVHCALESRELLTVCLKRLKGLNRLKLVDAGFVWTEPHSKRIKVKLVVHGEVMGAVLQKEFVVVYTLAHQMCDDCHRTEAKDYWKALVQVRQKAENKKTFYYLEQLILRHKAHESTLGIKPIHGGLDFFYATEAHAKKMVDFLTTVLPCKYQHSKKLISHDIHSNVYNYKFTYCVDIVPISKDSVVCLPKKLTRSLGGISPICLVYRVTNAIHLIDPSTGQICELGSTAYYRTPFGAICNPKQLVEYVVMDIEPIMDKDKKQFPGQGTISSRHVLADVWLVRASELGINENTTHARTHLGHVLKPGDSVLGYNIQDSNVNDATFENLDRASIPDVVLVKKHFGDRASKKRQRIWKLKRMAQEETGSIDGKDFNEFMDDLEEDPELRRNVNIFKDSAKMAALPVDMFDDNYDPNGVTLEEMLDDLDVNDVEMADE
ncbi:60S ribosomal export protein NMD3 [Anthonomus grandis grandis]|uniref:60S ribosomal export protein NMD3 n=1 Tax=Anthonomus grandis grandis TaxID=2921223 RepID=UPI0021651765|nr:60S ribosomal export protein NMD3 [Anthonomus grandis grandis]